MAWLWGMYSYFQSKIIFTDDRYDWNHSIELFEQGHGEFYFQMKFVEDEQQDYYILDGFSDSTKVPDSILQKVEIPETYPKETCKQLHTFAEDLFPG